MGITYEERTGKNETDIQENHMRKILVTTITPQDEKPKTGFRFMCKRTHRQLKDIAR